MQQFGVISAYVDRLAARLSFDPSLSRRVRREAEDHLWAAVAADPAGNTLETERRAVAAFGDPRMIAAQFAAASFAGQARRACVAVILVMAGVFIAMKARIAWYVLTQWALSDDMRAVSGSMGLIDRYAFWLSVAVGLAAWIYISRHRAPAAFSSPYRKRLHRFYLLCRTAVAALVVSIAGDAALTACRLSESELSAAFFVPLLLLAVEIVGAVALVLHLRLAARKIASAEVVLS